jgi:hypothetical protein
MGAEYIVDEIPAELLPEAQQYREHLIEKVSESDDKLLEKYLHGEEITEEEIKAALRKRVISSVHTEGAKAEPAFVPVICGSAFKNKGVQPLLDAVVDYLPSPLDVPAIKGFDPDKGPDVLIERPASDDAPFAALAFKIMTDPFVGQLTFIRVYSGVMTAGSTVFNATKGKSERLGRLLQMHANKREEIKEVYSGDIAAAVGLKSVSTGDTICDEKKPVVLESMDFPEPVISLSIEPKTKADQEKLGQGMQKLMAEDPTFRVKTDQQTGEVVISGMGELHLEIIVDRLKREFNVEASVGRPQVAYKETLTRPADGEMKYAASTVTRRFISIPASRAPATSSRTRSPAARFRRSSSSRSTRASRKRSRAASSPAIRSTTSGSCSTTGRITTSTRRKWRSRSPGRWRSRTRRRRRSRCCWSRSCASRWSCRRSTWATSSAIYRDAAATSSRRRIAAARRSSTRGCRCRRCSATRPTSGRGRRGARRIRCTSTATSPRRATSAKRWSRGFRGSRLRAPGSGLPRRRQLTEPGGRNEGPWLPREARRQARRGVARSA